MNDIRSINTSPSGREPNSKSAKRSPLRQLASLTWRESRSARRRLLLYMSSISLGVAALVAIDSFADNVTRSIREQSRALLGGDIAFGSRRPYTAAQLALLDSLARKTKAQYARVVTFPSMALVPRSGGTRLVQVRGVSSNYPFYGVITTQPAGRWKSLQSGPNALVDPSLLVSLNAKLGDTITLGLGRFVINGVLKDVPGTPGIAEIIGPRVFIPERYVPETQLLVFGSTADYGLLARLPNGTNPDRAIRPFRTAFEKQQIRARTVTQSEENTTDAIDQLSQFIGIVGLVALLLGGVGVASGVRAFVSRKIDTVAILRCLGASSGQVLAMYVAQAAAMGLLGALVGAALGVAVQFGLPRVFGDFLPVDVSVTLEPTAIMTGMIVGGWIALIFSLRPLLALRNVSPLQTLRRDADSEILRMRWNDFPRLAVDVALAASVVAIGLLRASDLQQGLWISGATFAVIAVLTVSAILLSWLARRTIRARWPYVVRQGVANLYRPANQTRSVVLSLGFGAFLITTLYLVQSNLLRQFNINIGKSNANLVFFDIQEDQMSAVDSLVRSRGQILQTAPIVTMRIASINNRSVEQIVDDAAARRKQDSISRAQTAASGAANTRPQRGGSAAPDRRSRAGQQSGRPSWALRREYRSSFRDTVTAGEKIVSGKWFSSTSASDTGEVSLDRDVAGELRVKLGDVITWDVQGVLVPVRVTSMREVTWARFEPNFFAVFSPASLRAAPKQHVILATVNGNSTIAALQRDIVTRFPNVSSLDLTLVKETVGKILDKVTTAIRFMALFSLAMGIPVLFSAVAATRRDRIREGVLLKTLGATRGQIMRILLAEYALLGMLGSLTGMLLAIGGGWALTHYVFESSFSPALVPAFAIALIMLALTIAIGLLAGRDVFKETPMTALREA
ncbi:MAG TPA: FtsX-like permease family protein [Gemmatimonadaceae bacterium]|nr:FtsX-like permease family protein [Gemmatimonadaceae bacterium]